jgi:hypothetical protein
MHVFDNEIGFILYRGAYLGYRTGFGVVSKDGSIIKTDTSILGSSIEYSDVIKIKDYYVVTEFNHNPGHSYQNLIIYDSNLTIINRQLVNHNVNQSKFIKTSDSTFLIYDESWTYQYTINFDSVPGYVSSVNTLFGNNNTELEVQVFPNPTSNLITIQYPKSQEIEVRIFTISGIQLVKKQIHNSFETVFDLGNYPKGMYLVQINTESGVRSVKVVKE